MAVDSIQQTVPKGAVRGPQRVAAHLRAPLQRNGYALVASTLATSGLGFLYWAIAARKYTAAVVGVNAVLVNTLQLLTNFASLNFTDVLNRFVPVSGERTRRLVVGSYAIAVGLGGAASAVFVVGLALHWWGASFSSVVHGPKLNAFFVISTMLWIVFVLQDAVMVGLRRASYVLTENAIYGVAKIGALVAFATLAPRSGIFLSWTAPLLVIVLVVNLLIFGRLIPAHAKERVHTEPFDRGHITRFLAADYVASMLWTATIWVLPVLVLATEGKRAAAYATIAWTIAYTLYLVSRNMGMSLTTEGSREPGRLAEHTRSTLVSTGRIVIPAALVLVAGAPLILRIFGTEYATNATTLMRLIALSTIPALVPLTFVSVARVQRRLTAMVVVTAATTVPVLVLTPIMLHAFGLDGVGWAWFLVQLVAALVLLGGEMRPHVLGRAATTAVDDVYAGELDHLDGQFVDEIDDIDEVDEIDDIDEVEDLEEAQPVVAAILVESDEPEPAAMPAPEPARRRSIVSWWPAFTIGGTIALWVVSLVRFNPNAMGELGLLQALPVTFYVALVVVTLGFACSLYSGARGRVAAIHAVLFIGLVHATPAISYGTLRYAWAWRHVGVIDLMMRGHHLVPNTPVLPIYQSWPGFFAGATALTEAGGLKSALSYASWAPAAFELLNALALVAIFSALTSDRRRIALAVWLFLIANWIGQDYLSPQAFGFFLYLVVIAVVLRWFRRRPEAPRFVRRRLGFAAAEASERVPPALPAGARRTVVWALLALMLATATSHPLTPIVMTIAFILLAMFRVLTQKWIAVVMTLFTAGWLITGARPYATANLPGMVSQFGSLGSNATSNLANVGVLSHAQQLVANLGRGVVLVLVVLALAGFIRRFRRGFWDAEVALLCIAPIGILVGGSYGGEAIFRAYLFALPFIAFFAAGCFYASKNARTGWRTPVAVVLLSGLLIGGFLFAYFGKEEWFRFTPQEVRAASLVFDNAPNHSLLIDGTFTYPTQFKNAERFTYVPLAQEPPSSIRAVLRDPVNTMYAWMTDKRYAQAYLIITRSQIDEADQTGLFPKGALQTMKAKLLASNRFDVMYHDPYALVLTVARPSTNG